MSAPLVSLCMGVYNGKSHLASALACLKAQTYQPTELVVVDDASTDGTADALAASGIPMQLVRRTSNSGTCELPRYQAVKAARGKYCAFLDVDDRWDPEFVSTGVAYLEQHPDVPLVHTYARVIDGDDRVLRVRHEGVMPTGAQLLPALFRHCYITISAVVVRREVWLEALREEEIRDFGMDLDFFIAIARRFPVGFIPRVLVSYRRSEYSVSTKKWRRYPRNVNTLERIWRRGDWRGILSPRDMVDNLVEAYGENAEYWLGQGFPARSRWFCRGGLRRRSWAKSLWKIMARSLRVRSRGDEGV